MVNKKNELENQYAINEQIKAKVVRLVGDNIPNPGIYSIQDALKWHKKWNWILLK